MSPYYMLLHEIVKFTDAQNLNRDLSISFLHTLFSSLSRRASESQNCDLVELAHDMTPGGYNEQAMKELVSSGAIDMWGAALDHLMNRLKDEQNI
jgi:pyrroline-5-carboxylate reductase